MNVKRWIKLHIIQFGLSFVVGLTIGLFSFYFNQNVNLLIVMTGIITIIAYVLCDALTIVTEEGWM